MTSMQYDQGKVEKMVVLTTGLKYASHLLQTV